MNIGEKIRLIRKEKGWTQRELAKRSGVSYASVCRWEKGQTEPLYFCVECLLNALGYRLEIVKDESNTYTGDPVRTD